MSCAALKTRLLWAKGQGCGMWANVFSLRQVASFGERQVLCYTLPWGLPYIKEGKEAPWRTVLPTEVGEGGLSLWDSGGKGNQEANYPLRREA